MVNYERTILELLERVAVLEDDLKVMKKEQIKADSKELHVESKKELPTFNKDGVIKEVKNNVDSLGIEVKKASIADGGGVVTKFGNNESKKVMLRRSRNYTGKGYKWRGWHTINIKDIKPLFDRFIFSVENDGKLHFFVLYRETE